MRGRTTSPTTSSLTPGPAPSAAVTRLRRPSATPASSHGAGTVAALVAGGQRPHPDDGSEQHSPDTASRASDSGRRTDAMHSSSEWRRPGHARGPPWAPGDRLQRRRGAASGSAHRLGIGCRRCGPRLPSGMPVSPPMIGWEPWDGRGRYDRVGPCAAARWRAARPPARRRDLMGAVARCWTSVGVGTCTTSWPAGVRSRGGARASCSSGRADIQRCATSCATCTREADRELARSEAGAAGEVMDRRVRQRAVGVTDEPWSSPSTRSSPVGSSPTARRDNGETKPKGLHRSVTQ